MKKRRRFFLTNISKREVKMSEKTKITLQVKVVNDPTSENVKVEIDSGITFLQLTKEVLKKLLTSKDKHPHGVLIAICGHIINMKILKDKKITLIPKGDSEKQCLFSVKSLAIRNESIINIVWIDKEIDFCFSWDAMEEKSIEIETAQNEKK